MKGGGVGGWGKISVKIKAKLGSVSCWVSEKVSVLVYSKHFLALTALSLMHLNIVNLVVPLSSVEEKRFSIVSWKEEIKERPVFTEVW